MHSESSLFHFNTFLIVTLLHMGAVYLLIQNNYKQGLAAASPSTNKIFATLMSEAPKPLKESVPQAKPVRPPSKRTIERPHEPSNFEQSAKPVIQDTPVSSQPVPLISSSAPSVQEPTSTAKTSATPATPKAVTQVNYLRAPQPEYPAQSKRLGEEGTVLIKALIDERGHPIQVSVKQSSGFPRLDKAAENAVRNTPFEPYREGGLAQSVFVVIPISFRFED
ncbi:MAG TPA: energy transducer TonB [Limnobacter sp.]|uniref:energy transducer TonB n=1 Tax=Limnobacter sp. TaxID=2003368 RepID=UPI002E3196EE|nr:energy transducer TonB [Limnobacter sp.]HEX5484810.1 energy transducer TonB [Limnobacter sp.]